MRSRSEPFPRSPGRAGRFLRVELRVQHATVSVHAIVSFDAIGRDAAISFAGNEGDAPVIPLAWPDADSAVLEFRADAFAPGGSWENSSLGGQEPLKTALVSAP